LSGHLNILKAANLIDVERRGVTLIFRINVSVAEEVISNLMSVLQVGEMYRADLSQDNMEVPS